LHGKLAPLCLCGLAAGSQTFLARRLETRPIALPSCGFAQAVGFLVTRMMGHPLVRGGPDLPGSGSSSIVIEVDRFPGLPGSKRGFGWWCKNFRVLAEVIARMALVVAIGSEF
jgi:hypothetical protein